MSVHYYTYAGPVILIKDSLYTLKEYYDLIGDNLTSIDVEDFDGTLLIGNKVSCTAGREFSRDTNPIPISINDKFITEELEEFKGYYHSEIDILRKHYKIVEISWMLVGYWY